MKMYPFASVLLATLLCSRAHAFVSLKGSANVPVEYQQQWRQHDQHHKLWSSPRHVLRMSRNTGEVSSPECDAILESSSKRKRSPLTFSLLSAAFSLCLYGSTPLLASAADDAVVLTPHTTSVVSEGATVSGTDTSIAPRPSGISSYFSQVFSGPDYGSTPRLTDSRFDDKEARNRAYDEAFQQDARDRDAYYGKMAMLKSEQALKEVSQNRRALGLDGDGDVRPRVGDEKVAGMASLRQYLLQQDPSTLTPDELKVYNRMKEREQVKEDI